MVQGNGRARVAIESATPADRERIYQLRHVVYASELGQHRENDAGRLTDARPRRLRLDHPARRAPVDRQVLRAAGSAFCR
jgi:hypothetical protein